MRTGLVRAAQSGTLDEFNRAWWDTYGENPSGDKLQYSAMVEAFLATAFGGASEERRENAALKIRECGVCFQISEADADAILRAGALAQRIQNEDGDVHALFDELDECLREAGYDPRAFDLLRRARSRFGGHSLDVV